MQGSWYSSESVSEPCSLCQPDCHFLLLSLPSDDLAFGSHLRDTGPGLEELLGRLCRDMKQDEGHGQEGKVSWDRKISMVDEEEEERPHGDDTKQTIRALKIQMFNRAEGYGEG